HLEHRSHAAAAAADQTFQRARNVLGNLVAGLGHQRHRAGLDAEPLQEIPLRHRAMDPRAQILGGADQRLKIDMGGDVGLAAAPTPRLPWPSISTVRSCQPVSRFTSWWIGSTSKYSLANMIAGPSG